MSAPKSRLKSTIQQSFKLHGFQLKMDACKHLEELLSALESDEWATWIDKILSILTSKDLESAVIDRTVMSKVIQECSAQEVGEAKENVFNVIDTFSVPRFTYCRDRKKFLSDENVPEIYADAEKKADVYMKRYTTLHQRTSRHKLFSPAVAGAGASINDEQNDKKYHLKTVDYLLGTTSKLTDVIVLGMLTQIKHGKYSLEDPTGVMDLDLSDAKFHRGLYTENCFVLVEGWYEDLIFHVAAMGHPPAETAESTRTVTGSTNFFGGPSETAPKSNQELIRIEQEDDDGAMLVFVSDVWLDKVVVMEKLSKLFTGYSAAPPLAFVFMGNFLSEIPVGGSSQHAKVLKDHFRQLGELISEYPELIEKSKFVFVPGNSDPGFPAIYPKPPIPNFIAQDFLKKVPNAMLGTNPCRIQYCTQEIVIFREDIISKMCRNCIYFPESGDIPTHFGRTIVSQGHLAPLPLHICPVYWDFDRSMWLYPLPDLLICADKFDPFITEHSGCIVVNPGAFAKNDFSFKTYIPKTKQVEDSQIPEDE